MIDVPAKDILDPVATSVPAVHVIEVLQTTEPDMVTVPDEFIITLFIVPELHVVVAPERIHEDVPAPLPAAVTFPLIIKLEPLNVPILALEKSETVKTPVNVNILPPFPADANGKLKGTVKLVTVLVKSPGPLQAIPLGPTIAKPCAAVFEENVILPKVAFAIIDKVFEKVIVLAYPVPELRFNSEHVAPAVTVTGPEFWSNRAISPDIGKPAPPQVAALFQFPPTAAAVYVAIIQ